MRKLASLILCFWLTMVAVGAANVTLPFTFVPNTLIQSSQVNSNFTSITAQVNGGIDNSNISATANINPSKLNLTVPYLNLVGAAGTLGFGVGQAGDTVARGGIYGDGSLRLGPGGSTVADIEWLRSAANTMQLAIPAGGTPKLDLNGATFIAPLTVGNGGTGVGTVPTNGQVPIGNGTTYVANTLTAGNGIAITNGSGTITVATTGSSQQNVRIYTTTGDPTNGNEANQTMVTTLYVGPYGGNTITCGNSAPQTFAEVSIAVPATVSTMYDLFAASASSTTITLSAVAWTNDTTRATGLTYSNGVYTLTGTPGKLYLGSFRTTTSSAQTERSSLRSLVWNYFNRVSYICRGVDPTASWTYGSTTARASDANTTDGQGRIAFITGITEDMIRAEYSVATQAGLNTVPENGIGLDSTTVNSAQTPSAFGTGVNGINNQMQVIYTTFPAIGYHFVQALEACSANANNTWYGGAPSWPAGAAPFGATSALHVELRN